MVSCEALFDTEFITRDTVAIETPARSATVFIDAFGFGEDSWTMAKKV